MRASCDLDGVMRAEANFRGDTEGFLGIDSTLGRIDACKEYDNLKAHEEAPMGEESQEKKKKIPKAFVVDERSGELTEHNLNPADNTMMDDFKEAFMPTGSRADLNIRRKRAGYGPKD